MGIVEGAGERAAPLEALGVAEVRGVGVLGNDRDGAEDADGFSVVLVELQRAGERRIEAGDGRADAESRTDQAVGSGARAAGRDRGAAGARADRAAQSAYAAAGRVLHDAGIDAENAGARFCAQQIGIGDIQVIAGDIEIEIVLERERDGVIDGEINFAILHERVDARRVAQLRLRNFLRRVGLQYVGKCRARNRIVLQMKRLRLRGEAVDCTAGAGARFLRQERSRTDSKKHGGSEVQRPQQHCSVHEEIKRSKNIGLLLANSISLQIVLAYRPCTRIVLACMSLLAKNNSVA